MKKILLAAALILPFLLHAQIDIVKKSVIILQLGSGQWSQYLSRNILHDDTSYIFSFRNTSFQSLVDTKNIDFTKPQLKEFAEACRAALKAGMQDQVWANHVAISKEKGPFGGTFFQLYYEHGFSSMKEKHVNQLIGAIEKE